jgi:hypothetical protein
MPRLPADIRISLKKRAGPTHRIELIRQTVRAVHPRNRSFRAIDGRRDSAPAPFSASAFQQPVSGINPRRTRAADQLLRQPVAAHVGSPPQLGATDWA